MSKKTSAMATRPIDKNGKKPSKETFSPSRKKERETGTSKEIIWIDTSKHVRQATAGHFVMRSRTKTDVMLLTQLVRREELSIATVDDREEKS